MMANGSKCRWGNFLGFSIFPLWIKPEVDPLEYVRRAKATMDTKKLQGYTYSLWNRQSYHENIRGKGET